MVIFHGKMLVHQRVHVYGFESTIQIPGNPQRSAVSQEEELWEVIGGAPWQFGHVKTKMTHGDKLEIEYVPITCQVEA